MTEEMDIMEIIREDFNNSVAAESENRADGVDDLLFLKGGDHQWDSKILEDRKNADRPCETINKLPSHVDQILGELRQNRVSIKVLPTGKPGSKEVADILEGMIRSIENLSKAAVAYQTGVEGAVNSGRGAWEVVTEEDPENPFNQVIRIKRIKNPYSVYFDPAAEEWDYRDGNYGFITKWITEKEHEREYPNADLSHFRESGIGDTLSQWYHKKMVRIAKYFRKVPVKKTVHLLDDGRVVDGEKWDSIKDDLKENERVMHTQRSGVVVDGPESEDPEAMMGTEVTINKAPEIVKSKEVETYEIKIYIINGVQVLSGPHKWAGKFIPIIPVWGKEMNVNGQDYYRGQIRHAKGPQRFYNYERNAEVERVALEKQPPYLVTPEQIEGHEHMWSSEANYAFRYYNHIPNVKPPIRTAPPQMSTGNVQQYAQAGDEIKATTGIFDASLGAKGNETSGAAINARKVQGTISNFTYMDNQVRAIGFTGEILVDLIPKIKDTESQEMILGEDGGWTPVTINQEVMDKETGKVVIINDLSMGKYMIHVSVGPHHETKRQETTAYMLDLMRYSPRVEAIGGDILVKNMDFIGADELARRLKMTLPPGMALDEKGQPINPPQPSMEDLKTQTEIEGQKLDNVETQLDIAIKSIGMRNFVNEVAQGSAVGAIQQVLSRLGIVNTEGEGGTGTTTGGEGTR